MASPTVAMVFALSSGISISNSCSSFIIKSTVSRLSAPRSVVNDAVSVTFDSSAPRRSTMISFTFDATSTDRVVKFIN